MNKLFSVFIWRKSFVFFFQFKITLSGIAFSRVIPCGSIFCPPQISSKVRFISELWGTLREVRAIRIFSRYIPAICNLERYRNIHLPFIGRRSWCCGKIASLVFPVTYRNLDKENRALDQLRATFQLFSLEKDKALKSDQVQEACSNLQTFDKKYLFKDMAVILSQYYSVSTDGVIRIPWDFSD